MKLQKFAIAAFALSLTGAIAAGNTSDDKSKQNQASASTQASGSNQPAGYADASTAGKQSRPQDTMATAQPSQRSGSASASGNGSSLASSGNGSSSISGNGSSASGHDNSTIRQVQQALQQKGHDPGQIDGQMGPNTKDALKSFQQAQGLQGSGQLNQQTLAALGVQGDSSMGQAGSSQRLSSQGQSSQAMSSQGQSSQGQPSQSTQGQSSQRQQ